MTDAVLDPAQRTDRVHPAHGVPGAFIYAYGTIQAYFPSLSVEREFYQALVALHISHDKAFDIHDEAALIALNQAPDLRRFLYEVFSKPDNASIAREMCWTIQSPSGSELFLIDPQNAAHLGTLIAALKPEAYLPRNRRVFIGQESEAHSNPLCAAWALPSSQLLHLFEAPVNSLSAPSRGGNVLVVHVPSHSGGEVSGSDALQQLVQSILQLADNSGTGDRNRTLNYVLLNQAVLFTKAWELAQSSGMSLTGARVEQLNYGGNPGRTRVIFDFSNTNGGAQSWYYIVDGASAFPYLVTDLQPFINQR